MKLGLGTAQFGSDYGITNARGKVDRREVESMLRLAADHAVEVLDTAAAYGDSEAVLGRALWSGHPFRIVTKCAPLNAERIAPRDAKQARDGFLRSLEKLRQPTAYGLLVHRAADLAKPGAEHLVKELHELKREGLVSRIGASFYDAREIGAVGATLALDIAQVPVSVADQRLLRDGTLQRLCAAGVEVHARSVFLQGVLLAERVPAELARFAAPLQRVAAYARMSGVSRVALALGFVTSLPQVHVAVVGAACTEELEEILLAGRNARQAGDFAHLAMDDEELLNPARWPRPKAQSNA